MDQQTEEQRLRGHAGGALDNAASSISRARDYLRDLPGPKPTERLETAMREIELARDELNQ